MEEPMAEIAELIERGDVTRQELVNRTVRRLRMLNDHGFTIIADAVNLEARRRLAVLRKEKKRHGGRKKDTGPGGGKKAAKAGG